MFNGYRTYSSFSIYHYHCIVGVMTTYPSNHCLSISFMTSHVNESKDLRTLLDNLSPSRVTELWLICHSTLGVKAQNLLTDTWSPTFLKFMRMSKHSCSSQTFAIIFSSWYQYSYQCGFSCTLCSQHCYLYISFDTINLISSDLDNGETTLNSNFDKCHQKSCIHIPTHIKQGCERLMHFFLI